MSVTYLELAKEEGCPDLPTLLNSDGLPPPQLDGIDFQILQHWSSKAKWKEICNATGLSYPGVKARWARPAFQEAVQRIRRSWFEDLSRGEYSAIGIAKANAVGNMNRLLGLAKNASNEAVKLNAIKLMLEYAGIVPPKALATERPETLLDKMTAEELEHFSRTSEFPRRLADQLARVAATVLEKRDSVTVEGSATSEWEVVGRSLSDDEAPAESPKEILDEDGPGWESLPDETELEG